MTTPSLQAITTHVAIKLDGWRNARQLHPPNSPRHGHTQPWHAYEVIRRPAVHCQHTGLPLDEGPGTHKGPRTKESRLLQTAHCATEVSTSSFKDDPEKSQPSMDKTRFENSPRAILQGKEGNSQAYRMPTARPVVRSCHNQWKHMVCGLRTAHPRQHRHTATLPDE